MNLISSGRGWTWGRWEIWGVWRRIWWRDRSQLSMTHSLTKIKKMFCLIIWCGFYFMRLQELPLTFPLCFWLLKQKRKGTEGIIEIQNPNLVKPKNVKAKNVDVRLAGCTFLCSIYIAFWMLILMRAFSFADWENNWAFPTWKVYCSFCLCFFSIWTLWSRGPGFHVCLLYAWHESSPPFYVLVFQWPLYIFPFPVTDLHPPES